MAGLKNSKHFPAFHMLPDYDSPWDSPCYEEVGGSLVKTRHWCFLADIIEVIFIARPRVRVRTSAGEEVVVHFHHERHEHPTTFQWEDIQPGRCLALQYAYRKHMMDFSEGIRFDYLDGVFVFHAPLEQILRVSDKISDSPVCFHQGCRGDEVKGEEKVLMRCARCKCAQFCCQVRLALSSFFAQLQESPTRLML
jgi:hypothetical protein